ncbi:MAG: hypothetical protein LBI63_00705 [Candidatus Ancillula sp.]|nr:hypothetical protein [Candidatus Ancillula sp.]
MRKNKVNAFAIVFASVVLSFTLVNSANIVAEAAIQNVDFAKSELVKSVKSELEPYFHDYSGQPSNIQNHGTQGTYFENTVQSTMTLAEKLYINVTGGENLKAKQDVENFLSSKHGENTCIIMFEDSNKNKLIGIDEIECSKIDDAKSGFLDAFEAKIKLLQPDKKTSTEAFEYLIHNNLGADVKNGCNGADACIFPVQGVDIGFYTGPACYIGSWKNTTMVLALKRSSSFYYDGGSTNVLDRSNGIKFANPVTVTTVNTY